MLADLAMDIYAAESAALRSAKIPQESAQGTFALAEVLSRLCQSHLIDSGRSVLPRFVAALSDNEDSFRKNLNHFYALLPFGRVDIVELESTAVAYLLEFENYPFP
jgi:hypothetical protein